MRSGVAQFTFLFVFLNGGWNFFKFFSIQHFVNVLVIIGLLELRLLHYVVLIWKHLVRYRGYDLVLS